MTVPNALILLAFALCLCVIHVQCFTRVTSRLGCISPSPLLRQKTHLQIAVHEAAAAGEFDKVREIIEKDPTMLSKYDIDGQLPLHHAAKIGHFEMVQYLNGLGPNYINFKNIRHRTPLHWAAAYAGYAGFESCEEIAYYLVRNGADMEIMNKDRLTPLDIAKKGPLGKTFWENLKKAGEGVAVRPLDIAANRVYWG